MLKPSQSDSAMISSRRSATVAGGSDDRLPQAIPIRQHADGEALPGAAIHGLGEGLHRIRLDRIDVIVQSELAEIEAEIARQRGQSRLQADMFLVLRELGPRLFFGFAEHDHDALEHQDVIGIAALFGGPGAQAGDVAGQFRDRPRHDEGAFGVARGKAGAARFDAPA